MLRPGDEAAALRRLLAFSTSPPERAAWTELQASGRIFGAVATFFLLDRDPQHDVEFFTVYTLGRLLYHLTRRHEADQVEYQGQVRGRVAWPPTFKARYAQDYDPTRFICREVRYRYDTPENQLLKFVLDRIGHCLEGVPDELRSGLYVYPSDYGQPALATAERLVAVEGALARLRRNVYLRQVSLPLQITEVHEVRAETAKMDGYRDVLRVYRRFQEVVALPSRELLYVIGRRVLPLPRRPDRDNALWFQLGAEILRAHDALQPQMEAP
jgi:hypothetical protein